MRNRRIWVGLEEKKVIRRDFSQAPIITNIYLPISVAKNSTFPSVAINGLLTALIKASPLHLYPRFQAFLLSRTWLQSVSFIPLSAFPSLLDHCHQHTSLLLQRKPFFWPHSSHFCPLFLPHFASELHIVFTFFLPFLEHPLNRLSPPHCTETALLRLPVTTMLCCSI